MGGYECSVVDYLGITSADRIAALLPFSFDYGLDQSLCAARTGACVVIQRTPVPQRIVTTLTREGVTVLPAVPPLWLQLLKVNAFTTMRLPALRVTYARSGRLPDAVRALRRSEPQAELVLMYGLTEAFRSTYLAPALVDEKPGNRSCDSRCRDSRPRRTHQRECRWGQVGELVHRGPTVALGYWNDHEATVARFKPLGVPTAHRMRQVVFWATSSIGTPTATCSLLADETT